MAYTKAITLLDGAMGTMLQNAGLKLGDRPETLSITAADVVEGIQRQNVQAGTRLLLANTFCANAHKLAGTGFEVEDVVRASVAVAKRARVGADAKVLLDVGPIGELLEPLGTLKFDEAYALYAQMNRAGAAAGAGGAAHSLLSSTARDETIPSNFPASYQNMSSSSAPITHSLRNFTPYTGG